MMSQVTAIVPAYRRKVELWLTLRKLQDCEPPPAEIIVHLDHGATIAAAEIKELFPAVRVLESDTCVGPGGARNKMIAAANTQWVASFDDDSYPEDRDYFAALEEVAASFPEASIIRASARIRGQDPRPRSTKACWVASFIGCACAYRRSDFMASTGYVPLPVAYGMEESDLALRYHAAGKRILATDALRVFHDSDLAHARDSRIVASYIANTALLGWLRYPALDWYIGSLQWTRQILVQVRQGRLGGVVLGVLQTPICLFKYAKYRTPISIGSLRSFLAERGSSKETL